MGLIRFLALSTTLVLLLAREASGRECAGLPDVSVVTSLYRDAASSHDPLHGRGANLTSFHYTCRSVGSRLFSYTSLGILAVDSSNAAYHLVARCTGGLSWVYEDSALLDYDDPLFDLPVTEQCFRCSVSELAVQGRCLRK